jgi:hypothetical protein
MRRSNHFPVIALLVLFWGTSYAQQPEIAQRVDHATEPSDSGCVLSAAKDGQVITVHGKTIQEPHDLGFDIQGCKQTVLLTYAGDQDNQVNANELRRDDHLARFQQFTRSTYKSTKKNICMQCMRYDDVEATLTGKLEVASIPPGTTKDPAGFLRDPSGKIVGKWGWGHPVPFAGYRLVIQSVSDVRARKIPRPTAVIDRHVTFWEVAEERFGNPSRLPTY